MLQKEWRRVVGAAGLVFFGLTASLGAVAAASPVGDGVAARLSGATQALDSERPVDGARLRQFYESRPAPVWFQADGTLKSAAGKLYEVLAAADQEGLSPADYHVPGITARLNASDTAAQVELELLLTDGLMAYAGDLRRGRVAPKTVSAEFALEPPAVNVVRVAQQVIAAPDLRVALAALVPPHPDYPGLREALKLMRAAQKAGGWPRVPVPTAAAKLEPGMTDAVLVPALRRRLIATGELDASLLEGQVYDAPLQAAVELFQQRNGLLVDGVVGLRTVQVLNTSAAERVDSILASMERLRWLPADFGARHVVVNIPGFSLQAVENGQVVQTMKVIVGTKVRRTPIFASRITSLIFNPTWTVPVKLAREDWLPKLRKDPNHLTELGMALYDGWGAEALPVNLAEVNWSDPAVDIGRYRITQAPGAHNSLGLVKFNIPNSFDVYLHDTPHREKFDRSSRTFSSGCVRVGDPMGLMAFVMDGMSEWPPERRKEVLDKGATRTVSLRRPVPVYLLYQTAWRDADGVVQFREDIYERDAQLLRVVRRAHEPAVAGVKPVAATATAAVAPVSAGSKAGGVVPASRPVRVARPAAAPAGAPVAAAAVLSPAPLAVSPPPSGRPEDAGPRVVPD